MIVVLKVVAVLVGFGALVFFGTQAIQQRLLYFPDTRRTLPGEVDLEGVAEREVTSFDGTAILTWWAAARPGRPTIVYFHGNAGAFVSRSERIRRYVAFGYGLVMMTYRGYGGSRGTPSERFNVADAHAVYDAVRASGVPAESIVLYGESLGSGVAVQVAAEKPVAAVILDAPYTSIVDVAHVHYPWLPARLLMTDRYDSLPAAARVTVPVLVVHGEDDEIIPVGMGRAVAAAIRGPATVATFPGAGHSDHYLFGSYDVIFDWLERLFPDDGSAQAAGSGR